MLFNGFNFWIVFPFIFVIFYKLILCIYNEDKNHHLSRCV